MSSSPPGRTILSHAQVSAGVCESVYTSVCGTGRLAIKQKKRSAPPNRLSSSRARRRRASLEKWCMTAIDSTASKKPSRYGSTMLSHTDTLAVGWVGKG